MSSETAKGIWTGRYRPLGLINNPFTVLPDEAGGPQLAAITIETHAASNQFIKMVDAAASEPSPLPLWIEKSSSIPNAYPLKAISKAENIMATDEELGILHAYVQLYLMRTGRIRSTLGVIGERLAFRSFDRTLAAWVERVLEAPDETLTSYQLLGPEGLARFSAAFSAEPLEALAACFGEPVMERQPDLGYIADRRLGDLKSDVEEDDNTLEVDSTVGEALGVVPLAAEDEKPEGEDELVADYLIEYAKQHLSPVIARALRTYQARGVAAMSTEFRVTKAPRKTLRAVVSFARCRFRKIVIIYDGFEGWINVPDELREQIVESLSEIRDMLAGDAFVVVMAEKDAAPELEQAFGGGSRLQWTFENLPGLETERDVLNPSIVDHWLCEASLDPNSAAIDMSDPVLKELADLADGSTWRFAAMAAAAIDDAAARGVSALDETARDAGLAAKPEEAGV